MSEADKDELVILHSNGRWSPKQVRLLIRYWGAIRSREIAAIVGKSNMACIGKAHRMGLPPVDERLRNAWCGHDRSSHGKIIQGVWG